MPISQQQVMEMIMSGQNPQQIVLNLMQDSAMQNNPMLKNLVDLASNGKNKQVENIVRNACSQQGKNFDNEFNSFKSNLRR